MLLDVNLALFVLRHIGECQEWSLGSFCVVKTSLDKTCTFQGRSMRIRIIEVRDRNTELHQEGHSVNIVFALFIFHMLIYFTPKGEGGGNRLH